MSCISVCALVALHAPLSSTPVQTVVLDNETDGSTATELLVRRYPVGDIVHGSVTSDGGPDGMLWLLPALGYVFPDDFGEVVTDEDGAWGLMESFQIGIGDELDDEWRSIDVVGDDVVQLRASMEAHRSMERELVGMRSALAADALLRVERYVVGGGTGDVPTAFLDVADARKLVAALDVQGRPWVRELRADAFHGSRAGGTSTAQLQRELDVEIATGSATVDAVYEDVEVGPSCTVRAAAGDGGWYVAAVVADRSAARDTSSPSVDVSGTRESGRTDTLGSYGSSARVDSSCTASSFFLPTGRAAVFTERGADGRSVVTVCSAVGGDPAILRRHPGGRSVVALDAATRPRIAAAFTDGDGTATRGGALRHTGFDSRYFQVRTSSDDLYGVHDLVGSMIELGGNVVREDPEEEEEEEVDFSDLDVDPTTELWYALDRIALQGPLHGSVVVRPEAVLGGRPFDETVADLVASLASPTANLVVTARVLAGAERSRRGRHPSRRARPSRSHARRRSCASSSSTSRWPRTRRWGTPWCSPSSTAVSSRCVCSRSTPRPSPSPWTAGGRARRSN
ncbi:MAG: hypothetical protein R3F34_08705 [Planctomycetota bacterium]